MNFGNLIKTAFRALSNNKMRALLTMLGIIIGISAVIVMMAMGQGAKNKIKSNISSMGSNLIMISPQSSGISGVRMSSSSMTSLKMSDYEAILREADYIKALTPSFSSSGQAIYAANNAPTTIYGVSESYLDIYDLSVTHGVMFDAENVANMDKVCVLGMTVVEELFGTPEEALGKVIRFNNIPITVIGVLEEKGANSMGMDDDDKILAPYTTIQKRVLAIDYVPSMTASAVSSEESSKAVKEIEGILRQHHAIEPGALDDFRVSSMDSLLSTIDEVMSTLSLLLAAIAGISLVVGGIGIMNIMYVSVTERTREIGLRLSIGAKSRHIMFQFLIESVIISILGGLIGIIFGYLITAIVRLVANFAASVQLSSVVVAFLVCTLTGVFFGWYPAKKAAKLDPIEALRYE